MKVAITESKVYKPEHIAIDPYQSKWVTNSARGAQILYQISFLNSIIAFLKYFELQEESFDQVLAFIGYIYLLNESEMKLKRPTILKHLNLVNCLKEL